MTYFEIPIGIDLHVHFREPGLTQKETMHTGIKAANATGIGTVVDMPNTSPITDTIKNVYKKSKLASSYPGIHIAGGFTNRSVLSEEINEIAHLTKILKVYLANSTGELGIDKNNFEAGLKFLEGENVLIMIHAEDSELISKRKEGIHENISRPPEAEISAINYVIDISKDHPNLSFHITHVSTSKGANLLFNQKTVSWDVLPKHLHFNTEIIKVKGNFAIMNPPLRSRYDQKKLLQMFYSEKIPIITSDHAPHTIKEKLNITAGAPGVQELYPFLIHHFLSGNISNSYVEDVVYNNPKSILENLNLSVIEGKTQVNSAKIYVFTKDKILSKCKWSLWENFEFKGQIKEIS